MSPTPLQRKFTLDLLTEWRKLGLPFAEETVLLAVSGGADSCSLALGVSDLARRGKLNCRFVIAHFDHGLRESESSEDVKFVENLAKEQDFGFVTARASRSVFRSKANLEEKARNARYRFLRSAAEEQGAKTVLTAHTRNDQAETLILNLLRGSGLLGLSGMGAVRTLAEGGTRPGSEGHSGVVSVREIKLYRPLLSWASREDTVKYVSDCGIMPRTDAMNEDLAFQRVRIRKEVLPILSDLNPNIVETLARTAETLRLELELLSGDPEELAGAEKLAGLGSIPVSQLNQMSNALAIHSVRKWLLSTRGSLRGIDRGRLSAIVGLAVSNKSGRTVQLPGKGRVVKRRGRLYFEDVEVEK